MLGQLCEPRAVLPPGPSLPGGAVRLPWGDAVVVVLGVVEELDDVEVAALASAASPPASAPVTTRVASRGLNRCRI